MNKPLSLKDRANRWAASAPRWFPSFHHALVIGYASGYKAAQRDARKNRTEETNGDYPG